MGRPCCLSCSFRSSLSTASERLLCCEPASARVLHAAYNDQQPAFPRPPSPAAEGAAPRAATPAPGTSTAEVDAAPPSSQRFSVPHLPYLVPPHMRKGKGGRQPAPDPRLVSMSLLGWVDTIIVEADTPLEMRMFASLHIEAVHWK